MPQCVAGAVELGRVLAGGSAATVSACPTGPSRVPVLSNRRHTHSTRSFLLSATASAAYRAALRAALSLTGGSVTLLAFGAAGPSAAVVSTLSVFVLSGIVGYNSVWSVTPALHSPLMSVTNAISGAGLGWESGLRRRCVRVGEGGLLRVRSAAVPQCSASFAARTPWQMRSRGPDSCSPTPEQHTPSALHDIILTRHCNFNPQASPPSAASR